MTTTTLRDQLLEGLPVAERRLTLAGADTAVLVGGDGPPIVLLHGPGGNAAHWAAVLGPLAATHRVIAPDLPGQGESASLEADRVLDWLGELIEQTCVTPPTLVGNALGGAIAASFAARHGDRLERLVLVDALGLREFEPTPEFGAALQAFMAEPTLQTHEGLWRHCAHDLDRLRHELGGRWDSFAAYNLDRARTPSVAASLGDLMHRFGLPATGDLERIGVDTSLIWGRHDLATPLTVAEAASARYDWPLHVIEDCADDPPVEQPEAFLDALAGLRSPGDPAYERAAQLWNGMITTRPAFVATPRSTADVVRAVRAAVERGLPVSVRGGGHNIAGAALIEGGVTIDMSGRRDVRVDPHARTATVQTGCLLGDVDRATQEHGLAVPLGFFSEVGVAGLVLGGGLGYLTRRFGWAVDNLLEAEIVTADGEVRRASRDEHADLFWALRGAGQRLGVVTELTFRLHEVGPTVYGGLIAWPFERAAEILDAYRALTEHAPRELAVWLNIIRAPEAPFVPPEWHGELVCAMVVCHSGGAQDALAPVRALGEPVFDILREQPYTEIQSYLDATEPKGEHYYWKTEYLAELGDDFLATLQELAATCPVPGSQHAILHVGGALNDRADDDGAVGNRDARYICGLIGAWEPGEPRAAEHRDWLRAAFERVRVFGTGGSYVNFQTADEGEDRIRGSYGANYDRVMAVKRRYDPGDVFRLTRAS
jgi:FAD/FMN-containing dehydrogenase/pimeloyl-ACP methyl ester carboxylesterase